MSAGIAITAALCVPPIGCDPLQGVGGSLAGDAANSVFSALSSWLASGAVGLVSHVLALLAGSKTLPVGPATTASVSSSGTAGFVPEEHFMVELMVLVLVPILFVSTLGALVRQDLGRLARTWFVSLPVALVCAAAGVGATDGAMHVTDTLSKAVLGNISVTDTFGKAVSEISTAPGENGPITTLVIAALAIVAGILLWLELVVRNAAVDVALLFLPLAMSGLVWPSTTGMAKRLVETLFTLVISKFVVAAVLVLGVEALVGGGDDEALTGVAILLLASFAPFAVFRMVPIVEANAVSHLEGLSRRPFRAAAQSAMTASNLAQGPIGAALAMARRSDEPPVSESSVGGHGIPWLDGDYDPMTGTGRLADGSLWRASDHDDSPGGDASASTGTAAGSSGSDTAPGRSGGNGSGAGRDFSSAMTGTAPPDAESGPLRAAPVGEAFQELGSAEPDGGLTFWSVEHSEPDDPSGEAQGRP